MPKILINEVDRTSPGTPGSYSNYTVLITGFMGREAITPQKAAEILSGDAKSTIKADAIQPDTNGVYEFNSAEDFKQTIGLCAPKLENNLYHYGNQMAYELLNMGYPIIYVPLKREIVTKTSGKSSKESLESFVDVFNRVASQDFWEIFKDKANYDFRFICHGFLNAATDSEHIAKTRMTYEKVLELINELDSIVTEILTENHKAPINMSLEDRIAIDDSFVLDAVDNGTENENNSRDPGAYIVFKESERVKKYYVDEHEVPLLDTYNSYFDITVDNIVIDGAGTGLRDTARDLKEILDTNDTEHFNIATLNKINTQIANLAAYVADANTGAELPGRGDCVALIEIAEDLYTITNTTRPETKIISAINRLSGINNTNGKYCALTVPSVTYVMDDQKEFGDNKKFPGAFHYLACFRNSLQQGFKEWYAAAGYTRGVSSYVVDSTSVSLGEIAINALEPRNIGDPQENYPKFACNVIANFRGSYYLWGNRTAHGLVSKNAGGDLVASHFLNIRQLCTTINKQLYVACRRFTFDPNSDTLWVNFKNAISPTLDVMKADQGIRDYRIIKEATDKKATLKARIRIIPIEAVEDFDIEISLEDSFGETVVTSNG